MIHLLHIIIISFVFLINNCVTASTKLHSKFNDRRTNADSDNSIIYIYRPQHGLFNYPGVFLYTYVDDKQVGTLHQEGQIAVEIPKGQHTVYFRQNSGMLFSKSPDKQGQLYLTTQANKAYFIRAIVVLGRMIKPGMNKTNTYSEQISSSQGLNEMRSLAHSSSRQ